MSRPLASVLPMSSGAYVRAHIDDDGSTVICEACGIRDVHPRTKPAQAAAAAHNRAAHAYPEQPLDFTDPERIAR